MWLHQKEHTASVAVTADVDAVPEASEEPLAAPPKHAEDTLGPILLEAELPVLVELGEILPALPYATPTPTHEPLL